MEAEIKQMKLEQLKKKAEEVRAKAQKLDRKDYVQRMKTLKESKKKVQWVAENRQKYLVEKVEGSISPDVSPTRSGMSPVWTNFDWKEEDPDEYDEADYNQRLTKYQEKLNRSQEILNSHEKERMSRTFYQTEKKDKHS